MVDTPRITKDSVAQARQALIEQGRKPSQRLVIKHLGGGSFSQVGPLLRELAVEAGEVSGSALTEPLTAAVGEAVESLWRELGKEADRVVGDARAQFERELAREQQARSDAESAARRVQDSLIETRAQLAKTETALNEEQAARERIQAALEQERLAHTKTDAERAAAEESATERQTLFEQVDTERKTLATNLDEMREKHERERQVSRDAAAAAENESREQIHTLNQLLAKAQTTITTQQGQLDTLAREKSNLSTINAGLSARIEAVLTDRGDAQGK